MYFSSVYGLNVHNIHSYVHMFWIHQTIVKSKYVNPPQQAYITVIASYQSGVGEWLI